MINKRTGNVSSLKKIRKISGLTQRKATLEAEKHFSIKFSERMLQKAESGKVDLDIEFFNKLADFYSRYISQKVGILDFKTSVNELSSKKINLTKKTSYETHQTYEAFHTDFLNKNLNLPG